MDSPPLLPTAEFNALMSGVYGTQLVGSYLGAFLYGFTCLQTIIYYLNPHSKSDPFLLRSLPFVLCVLDAAHQGLLCSGMYKTFIYNSGSQNILNVLESDLLTNVPVQGLISVLAHLFYCHRIHRFGGKKAIAIYFIAVPLTLTQLALLIWYTTKYEQNRTTAFNSSLVWGAYSVYGIDIALDIMFTVCMTYLLHKEKYAFQNTQAIVNRLTLLVVNTGLITTVAYIVAIILLTTLPGTVLGYTVPVYFIAPLYCNSVLANLNSRQYVRTGRRFDSAGQIELSTPRFKVMSPIDKTSGFHSASGSTTAQTEYGVASSLTEVDERAYAV